jgi:hypothetical protein
VTITVLYVPAIQWKLWLTYSSHALLVNGAGLF